MAAEVEAKAGVRPQRFLVQEMVGGGTELILGMHRDPLGTAILLGMGGVTAELFKDTTMRLLPPQGGLSREEALGMARELKTWPLLDGFRGRPKADVEALVSPSSPSRGWPRNWASAWWRPRSTRSSCCRKARACAPPMAWSCSPPPAEPSDHDNDARDRRSS